MAGSGSQELFDWQSGLFQAGDPRVDWLINTPLAPNRWGVQAIANAFGWGQAADANAGKRDQDGFLVPGYGATTTTGRVVKQENGTYRIPVKDLQTGKVSWRIPTAQEEAYAGVNSKTSKEETTAANLQTHLERRQDQRDGRRHQEVMAQLDLTGRQIQAGIDANRDSNQLGIATLQAQISQNEAANRQRSLEFTAANKQRSLEFSETMRYQATAMNQANLLKAQQLAMDDTYRRDALAQAKKTDRLNAVMALTAALTQAKI